jgi:hypothetical protein
MTTDRIKEIQQKTAHPNSVSVQQALLQVWNECEQDNNKEKDWTNFESELMDWAHELGKEQKYIPFPVQVLEWLKNNYKLPQKK